MTALDHYTATWHLGELADVFAALGELYLALTIWTALNLVEQAS